MSDREGAGGAGAVGPARYAERLFVPWWWYPVALAVAALLAGEVRLGGWPLTDWVPFVIFLPAAVGVAWSFGRARVVVTADELQVRNARLPLDVIATVIPLDAHTLTRAVGRHGDPLAFVFIRAWTHGGVQIILDDPDDPTPYWIISSRHPDALTQALDARLATDGRP